MKILCKINCFYHLLSIVRYFPFGVDGMLAGSSTVFFAYIGFDSVASTAEEVFVLTLGFFVQQGYSLIYFILFWLLNSLTG